MKTIIVKNSRIPKLASIFIDVYAITIFPFIFLKDEGDKDTESLKRSKEERSEKVKKKNDINYFNILIVIIISFIALILILDTFKVQLSLIIPNIEIVLDNLYLSINDIKLFFLDLIK